MNDCENVVEQDGLLHKVIE